MNENEQKVFEMLQERGRMSLIGICHHCGISRLTALKAVKKLLESDSITAAKVGRAYLYTFKQFNDPKQLQLWK